MSNKQAKYTGFLIDLRKPTVKISRGKEYPSLDIRNSNIEKKLNKAAAQNLCPVFMYNRKGTLYYIPMLPEHINLTTLSCKYGKPFTAKHLTDMQNRDFS